MELVTGGLHGEEVDMATDKMVQLIISWCHFQNSSMFGLLQHQFFIDSNLTEISIPSTG